MFQQYSPLGSQLGHNRAPRHNHIHAVMSMRSFSRMSSSNKAARSRYAGESFYVSVNIFCFFESVSRFTPYRASIDSGLGFGFGWYDRLMKIAAIQNPKQATRIPPISFLENCRFELSSAPTSYFSLVMLFLVGERGQYEGYKSH